ncbi:MlaD family protein [bacterium]|nr:MlaD family protein [bacterium]
MSRTARLGTFIFGSLLILAAAVFFIGQKEFLFSKTYRLQARFENVMGLNDGAPVRVGGVHVGTVDHIRMPSKAGDQITVVMDLKSSTQKVLKKDSAASILTEGLLGNKYVSISFGSEKAEPVRNGDTIRGYPSMDFTDLIEKSGKVLDVTKATLANVEQATVNLKSITCKIDQGQGTVGQLVNDRKVYDNINKTVVEAQAGVTSFHENMEALKGNFLVRGFFKKRGYFDSAELTNHEIGKFPKQSLRKKFIYRSQDLFEKPTTARFRNEKPLNRAGEFLERAPFDLVVVTAYTGEGEKEKSLELTRAQAMVVRQYLVEHFKVDDSRLKTKGMGDVKLPQTNRTSRDE